MSLSGLRKELEELGIQIKDEDSVEKLNEVALQLGLKDSEIAAEWMAFSLSNQNCPLDLYHLERFISSVHSRKQQHTPVSQRTASRTQTTPTNSRMLTKDTLHKLFSGTDDDDDDDDDDAVICSGYGVTPDRVHRPKVSKRNMASPATPVPSSKYSTTTPKTPVNEEGGATFESPSSLLTETPTAKYGNRQNRGSIASTYNDTVVPSAWAGVNNDVIVDVLSPSLTMQPQFMYQNIVRKSSILIDRVEEIGQAICDKYDLNDKLELGSLSEPNVNPMLYIGMIGCEGEGRLNPQSCTIEGVDSDRGHRTGGRVRLDIPNELHPCSLFPGQVVVVEGILNHSQTLIPSRIYHEGVLPDTFDRSRLSIGGFTAMIAVGPFTTSDNLDMSPLNDLLDVVKKDKPNLLLLFGPFLDVSHSSVQNWNLDSSYKQFFIMKILPVIVWSCRSSGTKVVVVPSHNDVCHPYWVYPQPPFSFDQKVIKEMSGVFQFVGNPATLSVNGVRVGMTSTDVLFHLSSRTMFCGPTGDRMAALASQVLRQQSYYPLYPSFSRDEAATDTPYCNMAADMNIDLTLAYDERCAVLPVLPDVLVLPSDLKPFVKVVDGCVCVNPGHLTKKAGGGTFVKMIVKESTDHGDVCGRVGTQIVQI